MLCMESPRAFTYLAFSFCCFLSARPSRLMQCHRSKAALEDYYARFPVYAQLQEGAKLVAMPRRVVVWPARAVFAVRSSVQGQ